jgi:chromosome segregation protein
MFLKRLHIVGFKSFANVTNLDFEPGITAIVGPNGSGKSNIADAIRWVLGEGSSRNLRHKKNEDLVFAGTDSRAKASLAEVRLLLDNSDGAINLEASEIELSRILYRSGETEYRLNGRKATLKEVQQLLAAAGFGLNSYSVIGQGVIDSFVLATPSERKLLFDEASGIRGYELQREQAVKKLTATTANRQRVGDILTELVPRLKNLAQAAEAAERKHELAAELEVLQAQYYGRRLLDSREQQAELKIQLETVGKQLQEAKKELAQLEAARHQLEANEQSEARGQARTAKNLQEIELERDQIANDLSVKRAEFAHLEERLATLDDLPQRLSDLEAELSDWQTKHTTAQALLKQQEIMSAAASAELDRITAAIGQAEAGLSSLRRETAETSQSEYVNHALGIIKELARALDHEAEPDYAQVKLMVHKAGRLLSHATLAGQGEIVAKIKAAQAELSQLLEYREKAHDHYTEEVIKVRSFELDVANAVSQIERGNTHLAALQHQQTKDQAKITSSLDVRQQQITKLEGQLAKVGEELTSRRSTTVDPASTAQAFELARKYETARAGVTAFASQQTELQRQLDLAQASEAEAHRQAKAADITPNEDASIELTAAELERRVITIRAKLEDSSLVDDHVVTEYQEATERHTFLTSQLADLKTADEHLQSAIASLDKVIKAKFEVAFADISQHFQRYFQTLFNGGKASLVLRRDEDDS